MRKNLIIMFAFLCCLLADAARAGIELLTPPQYISTAKNRICLVGRSSAEIVDVFINGEFAQRSQMYDSFFHSPILLSYGLIKIDLKTIDDASQESYSDSLRIEIMSGPQISRRYASFFSPFQFHADGGNGICVGCHVQASGKGEKDPYSEWCIQCHPVVAERFQEHVPEDDQGCGICHWLNEDLSKSMRTDITDRNPCFHCHTDKLGQFVKEYIHGPVAGGSCVICHDPHGSLRFESNLVSPVSILCLTCHVQTECREMMVQHDPFVKGECTECHDPHATENRWVLIRNSVDLCSGCHDEDGDLKNHKHPYNTKPRHELATSLQLTPGGKLECLTCHHPHATNVRNLLRTNNPNTCAGCHPEYQ